MAFSKNVVILHGEYSCPKLQNPTLMRMDSATSPSASRRMTGGRGGIQRRVKVLGLENPTEMKSVALSMDFLMMDCVLVRIVAMCIDYGLMLIGFD